MEAAKKVRNVLLISFVLTYLIVLLSFILYVGLPGFYETIMTKYCRITDIEASRQILMLCISLMKIFGVTFFLIPAIAIHIEYKKK